jgi:hypothetical protein
MATVTLRPNSVIDLYHGSYWSNSGGSYEACLGDGTDATWAYTDVTLGGQYIRCGLTTFAIPSLAQIRSVQGWGRSIAWNAANNWFQLITFELRVWNVISATTGVVTSGWSQIETRSTPAPTTNPQGGAWTQGDIDGLEMVAFPKDGGNAPGASSIRTYDLWATVIYNAAPAAVISAPSGLITSLTPNVAWTYSDPEGDAQERYTLKVFALPAAGWGSIDPATSPSYWNSGDTVSAASSRTPDMILKRGVTYRTYLKVGDAGSGGRYGNWAPGPEFKVDNASWGAIHS